MNQENHVGEYSFITAYIGQPINVNGKDIEMSFKLYRSRSGYLGWSIEGKPDINPLMIKTDSATHIDIGSLLLQMVQAKSKISPAQNSLDMLLGNEYLVAMILTEICSEKAP